MDKFLSMLDSKNSQSLSRTNQVICILDLMSYATGAGYSVDEDVISIALDGVRHLLQEGTEEQANIRSEIFSWQKSHGNPEIMEALRDDLPSAGPH